MYLVQDLRVRPDWPPPINSRVEERQYTELVKIRWSKKQTKNVIMRALKEVKGVTDARKFSKEIKAQVDDLVDQIDSWPSFYKERLEMWIRFKTTPENFMINVSKPQFQNYNELVDESNCKQFCRIVADLIELSVEAIEAGYKQYDYNR